MDNSGVHMTEVDIENAIINKKKKIWIRYNDDEEELSILQSETVGDLKNKIEKKFSLGKNFLKGVRLRMKYNGQREGKLLENDETTIRENHVKNGSTIILGRTKNRGGNI